FLIHTYTGHDNNRDWYMFTQRETRLTVEHMYHRWHPQIVSDLHQMGTKGARLFLPPYLEPYEPNVDPALRDAIEELGSAVAAQLLKEGKSGIVTRALFDAWTPSRAYAHTHGGVRILSECASALLASPLRVPYGDLEPGLGYDPRRVSSNFQKPWPGGVWRLRDIMEYELAASRLLLLHAAQHRESWLRRFLEVNRRAASRLEPYAFLVPERQRDTLGLEQLLLVMRLGEVEIERAGAPFFAERRSFPAGTHVIRLAQPAGAFAKSLLERQAYPDVRLETLGPVSEPYDVTAHTLPLLLGVDVVRADRPFVAALSLEGDPRIQPGRVAQEGALLALDHTNASLVALGRLLREGVPVRWATRGFWDHGNRFAAGTLAAPGSARALLGSLAAELGTSASVLTHWPQGLALKSPRVGVYQSFVPTADEGWTRFVFEKEMDVSFETLHDADFRSGDLGGFNAIVLPDQTPAALRDGNPPGSLPPEYVGGMGAAGLRRLREWVEGGGSLIALNQASRLVSEGFGLPLQNVPAAFGEFRCPGSLLAADLVSSSPLGHGLPKKAVVWFENGPVFEAPPA
ncbi:MAG TPA: hypothetical protein VN083_10785, partial [Vicinamibacteria bacterium]|nr:hypothetical protein [Vicinamibacteria bacterium]